MSFELPSLVSSLTEVSWDWSKEGVQNSLESLGWKSIEEVMHRREYHVKDNVQASVYFESDKCLLVEIVLDWYGDVQTLDKFEYEDKVDEYYQKYEQTVRIVENTLGKPPIFNNGAAAKGFPIDQDAVWLALWRFPNSRLMVEQKHEDRELPFRICLVVAPLEDG